MGGPTFTPPRTSPKAPSCRPQSPAGPRPSGAQPAPPSSFLETEFGPVTDDSITRARGWKPSRNPGGRCSDEVRLADSQGWGARLRALSVLVRWVSRLVLIRVPHNKTVIVGESAF